MTQFTFEFAINEIKAQQGASSSLLFYRKLFKTPMSAEYKSIRREIESQFLAHVKVIVN